MSTLTLIMLIFALLGAADRIVGNRLGLGKEFNKGFMLLGDMALSMIGMITLAPLISSILEPAFDFIYGTFGIDPSIIPASLFANDMGGAPFATEVARDVTLGRWSALVVSSMLGCTVSFTIPFALGVVPKEKHDDMFLGILCGIATIPLGVLVGGLVGGVPILSLLFNMIPLILFSGIVILGLSFASKISVKIFSIFGILIKGLITAGLMLGIINFLSGKEIIKGLAPLSEGVWVCVNASIFLSGAFVLVKILSKLLNKPLLKLGRLIGINEASILGIVSSIVSSAPTFGKMGDMDKKGTIINSAFSVSGAFILGGHMAFTMAFDGGYVLPVIVGKAIGGVSSLFVAVYFVKRAEKKEKTKN